MAGKFQPPPTWALPILVDEKTGKAIFSPVWLRWFLDLSAGLASTGAGSGDIVGPGSSTANRIALFADTTGILLKELSSLGTTTTLLHGNAAGAPTFAAVSLTADVSGILPEANGGTGESTYALGDTLYASATNNLAKLAGNITTTQKFLSQTGDGSISAAPSWQPASFIPYIGATANVDLGAKNFVTSGLVTGVLTNATGLPVGGITATGTPNATSFLRGDSTWSTPAGAGDVAGPAGATANNVAVFNGATGKIIKDGGPLVTAVPTVVPVTAATHNEAHTSGIVVILGDTTSNSITVNLPTAVGNTAIFSVKKTVAANTLTVDGLSTETIDGGLTAAWTSIYEAITLVSDGTNWSIV